MRQVFITGAAGLVGQNLIPALKASGEYRIVAADKHPENTAALRDLHPDIQVIETDLAENGGWEAKIAESELVVLLHAQIGGLDEDEFIRNNIVATEKCLAAMNGGRTEYIVHVSSSVVNSQADDFYTRTKGAQEDLVKASSIPHVVLRPTLMFGWFDRKHLGWLRRFMERAPVFPIPGDGKYLRQPLYAGDFSAIIHSCLQSGIGGNYNISGRRKINYVDLIREIKSTVKSRAIILNIPYWLFWSLLKVYALFDRDPPFTTSQLRALATPDIFEVIDWPEIFNVQETPLREALEETFLHPEYSKIELTF